MKKKKEVRINCKDEVIAQKAITTVFAPLNGPRSLFRALFLAHAPTDVCNRLLFVVVVSFALQVQVLFEVLRASCLQLHPFR